MAKLRLYLWRHFFIFLFLGFTISKWRPLLPSAKCLRLFFTERVENFDGVTPIPALPAGWVSVAG